MKLTNLIMASALIAGAASVKIAKDDLNLSLVEECLIGNQSLVQKEWHQNLPDIYGHDFGIVRIFGQDAVDELKKVPHMDQKADFVIAYHPECPHCVSMVQEVEQLAKKATEEDLDVNVVTINMSKSMDQVNALDVHAYPTIRLYKNDGKAIKFPRKPRKMENMLEFLHENGITQKKK